MEKDNFQVVFEKLVKNSSYTDAELSRRLNVNRSTIGRWRRGEISPPLSKIKEIANIFGVSPLKFISDEIQDLERPKEAISIKGTSVQVPLYGSIAAGIPLEAIPIEEYIEIPEDIGNWYPEAFLLRVNGDSMNKVVPNGAYALISPYNGEDVGNGDVVAVQVNGYEATLKRFFRLHNTVVLEPDSYNPDHVAQNFTSPELDSLRIMGKLVWYMSPPNVKY
ncbi:LexA family protein [Paenibacillus sp. B2(2019)]|uniref:LexA family protein n=1 Tax=Paenibacillus sp. B2(2019) TaxID=2607754 RepID=UPI0011F1C8FD|nr:XRE family transcriptional regulator [Paenibacillus sp. B2(2019)]KAA1180658.1 helix-turn-helix domain-containing protein [Paenibacillus sp. B2(2019)]